jgi:hypothetical protein
MRCRRSIPITFPLFFCNRTASSFTLIHAEQCPRPTRHAQPTTRACAARRALKSIRCAAPRSQPAPPNPSSSADSIPNSAHNPKRRPPPPPPSHLHPHPPTPVSPSPLPSSSQRSSPHPTVKRQSSGSATTSTPSAYDCIHALDRHFHFHGVTPKLPNCLFHRHPLRNATDRRHDRDVSDGPLCAAATREPCDG